MSIDSVLICGGTHGNELSGVYALRQWQQNSDNLRALIPSAELSLMMVNEAAISARTRYIDEDLNRQFDLQKLAENKGRDDLCHEAALAQSLNRDYGPKSDPQIDFLIDIHNTTSAMGPTLIVLENDSFNHNLARYVKTHMPHANILVEDHIAYQQHPYFCTLGKRSVMIEVGPQAQGTLRAEAYEQTVEMTELILSYIEAVNSNTYFDLSAVPAFRLTGDVLYPKTEDGVRSAMIHPSLDGRDFKLLMPQTPCFIDFKGENILWKGGETYPHFIGEAAYDGLNIAFATAEHCLF
jgi:aspartoacylase